MSKWILMPDSFKGTMSSLEICQLMREALLRHVPDAEVVSIPVADGGEGSVEAFLAAMGGHRVEVPCTGPDFRKISGFYGLLADGYTAVIEMAAAAGLPLMEGRLCAEGATTYGVGELILRRSGTAPGASFWAWAAVPPTTAAAAVPPLWASAFWTAPGRSTSL